MKLIKGDCLIENNKIESGSVDLILTDLPYGTITDLYDNCKCNKLKNLKKERKIRVYTRDNKISIYWENSGDATLKFDGNIVEKVVIEKPVTN